MALTPNKIEKTRAQIAKRRKSLSGKLSLSSFNSNAILNSVPGNLKVQGQQKLSSLFLDQGNKLLSKIVPSLDDIITKFGITDLENQINGEGVDLESLKSEYCPTKPELDKLILQRNNLVDYLNGVGTTLDRLSTTVNFGAGIASLLQGVISGLRQGKTLAQIALSFIPVAPGAATSAIDVAGDKADDLTFKKDGTPRIPPLTIIASAVSPSISAVQSIVLKVVTLLEQVDLLITLCDPNSSLTNTSKSIQDTANNELIAENSVNETTYKGFILEIETKAYTDTVNQSRAVAKNKSNIILLTTEYSFASDPNVLIEEIKFIIDRDDLKAY
jgi:hypothetical protein